MTDQPADKAQTTPPCLMVIFGASGDLTKRLLLPSIYNLIAAKVLPDDFQLLGVASDAWQDDKFRDHVRDSLKEFWGAGADAGVLDWLTKRSFYQAANFTDPASFDQVAARIADIEKTAKSAGNRLFYLAIAPGFISSVTALLSQKKLLEEDGDCFRRLIIEKPFGHDLPSAIALNAELQKSLREDQIYRIDHFAGKDAVQDLAVFRFSNAIIEPIWNRSLIDNVQITAAETVGVEMRAGYYETAGALRDMVPNHLAELLSLVAMEPPVSFSAEHLRDKQVEVLDSTRKIRPEEAYKFGVRGQYGAGEIDVAKVPAYKAEPGVKPDSFTETYAALKIEIDNWRWSGVPFYLRTGKRMTSALTEIAVTFRQPPARLFPNAHVSDQSPNKLVFNLKPQQGMTQTFGARAPGLTTVVNVEHMSYQFPDGPFGSHATGYERLLHDAMVGDMLLFQRAEFVEQGWKMVQPFLDAWSQPPHDPFPNYAAGSAGPTDSDDLLARAGHNWQPLCGKAKGDGK